jgi:hypothetical protein
MRYYNKESIALHVYALYRVSNYYFFQMLLNRDEVGEASLNENGLAGNPKIEVICAPEVGDAVAAAANEKLVFVEDGGCGVLKPKPEANGETPKGDGEAVIVVEFVCAPAADPNLLNVGLVAESAIN